MATPIFRTNNLPPRPGPGSIPGTRQQRPARPSLSVLLPARNEADGIAATIRQIVAVLETLDLDWEFIVVDDGSTDATAEVVAQLEPELHVGLLRLSRNFGKEAAITAGLDHANGDAVLCMDADGQHPAELIPALLQRWREGYEMVYGVRNDRHTESSFKRLGSRLFYRLMRRAGEIEIPPDAGDFRWMDRCVVDAIRRLPEHNRFMKGLYSWVGFRSIGIEYTPRARSGGQTHFSRSKLASLAWNGITGFSVLPLRAASIVGALLAAFALAYAAYELVYHLIYGTDVPGWPTVVIGMMFFSGVQLLFIGILGEYLARVYDEVKGRPTYVVAQWQRPDDSVSRSRPAREHAPG